MDLYIKKDDLPIFDSIIAELELKKLKLNENGCKLIDAQIEVYQKLQKKLIIIKNEKIFKML